MKTIAVTAPRQVEIIDSPTPVPGPYQALREGKLSASEFITHRFSIGEIDAALEAVRGRKVVKALLSYE